MERIGAVQELSAVARRSRNHIDDTTRLPDYGAQRQRGIYHQHTLYSMCRHLLRLDLWWDGQRHHAAIEIDILEQETRP